MLRNKTCCFTGHRSIPPQQLEIVKRRLEQAIAQLVAQGVFYFGAGGALGFDTLAAQAVVRMKMTDTRIKLILVLPCRNQSVLWPHESICVYKSIMTRADKIVYTSEFYNTSCMRKRNMHLVNNSAHCICYLQKNCGGTFFTVQYAKYKGLTIINLA